MQRAAHVTLMGLMLQRDATRCNKMLPDQTWRLTQGRKFFPVCWGQHVGWTMSFRITVFQVSLFVSSSCSECCPVSVWFQSGTYEILGGDVFVQYFPPKERSFTKGFNVEKTSSIYAAQPPKFFVCEKRSRTHSHFHFPSLKAEIQLWCFDNALFEPGAAMILVEFLLKTELD